MPFIASILTLFPDMFPGPLGQSLIGKALDQGLWRLNLVNIRDYATDKHGTVDDTPYGGGAGMVMRPDIVDHAIEAVAEAPGPLLMLSPRGKPLTQNTLRALSNESGVRLLCGRYEGIDQRVLDKWQVQELSLGDYILAGGELAAMVLLEGVLRLRTGVIGAEESLEEESFENGLLEYPHYTRPALWDGRSVPTPLTSGHHAQIKAWRYEQAKALTQERRPDLWQTYQSQQENQPMA